MNSVIIPRMKLTLKSMAYNYNRKLLKKKRAVPITEWLETKTIWKAPVKDYYYDDLDCDDDGYYVFSEERFKFKPVAKYKTFNLILGKNRRWNLKITFIETYDLPVVNYFKKWKELIKSGLVEEKEAT